MFKIKKSPRTNSVEVAKATALEFLVYCYALGQTPDSGPSRAGPQLHRLRVRPGVGRVVPLALKSFRRFFRYPKYLR